MKSVVFGLVWNQKQVRAFHSFKNSFMRIWFGEVSGSRARVDYGAGQAEEAARRMNQRYS